MKRLPCFVIPRQAKNLCDIEAFNYWRLLFCYQRQYCYDATVATLRSGFGNTMQHFVCAEIFLPQFFQFILNLSKGPGTNTELPSYKFLSRAGYNLTIGVYKY